MASSQDAIDENKTITKKMVLKVKYSEPNSPNKKKNFERQFTTATNRPRDQPSADHMFLEHFNQVKFRDFTHNTRLNINSHNYTA